MKIISSPKITFKCDSCGATNEGEPEEFEEQNTMPPSWLAECGFCRCRVRCFPTPLIARAAGNDIAYLTEFCNNLIVRDIMES
jgi:hypothetical protein